MASRRRLAGRFPGWTVVAGCFIVLTTSSGLGFYGLAVYLNAFSNETGLAAQDDLAGDDVVLHRRRRGRGCGGAADRPVRRSLRDRRRRLIGGVLARRARTGRATVAAVRRVRRVRRRPSPPPDWCRRRRSSPDGSTSGDRSRCRSRRPACRSAASSSRRSPSASSTTAGCRRRTPWLGLVFVVGIVPFAWFMVRPDPADEGWNPDGKRIVVGDAPARRQRVVLRARRADALLHRRHDRLHLRPRLAGRRDPAARQARRGSHRPEYRPVRHHRARRDVGRRPSRRRAASCRSCR